MKIVMFKGGVETQEFFSLEIAKTFQRLGYEVFFYDLLDEWQSFCELKEFCREGRVFMFTFNFNGIAGENYLYDTDGSNFWDKYEIICLNMVVDHPLYYHKYLELVPKQYYQISIDRYHEAYMKRYFPDIVTMGFLPLGGTRLETGEALIPVKHRPIDLIFTGNYTRPETFHKFVAHLDKEYIDFYYSIQEEMIANPSLKLEELAEKRLLEELGPLQDKDLKSCYSNMIFIDLSVRFHFRGLAVKELVNNGLQVHVYGAGWDALDCKHPENLIRHGGVYSLKCLEMISQAKISLNVMPWFKDGAHDRIFNSMLNGALSLTDDSGYLREEFTDGKDIRFYSLRETQNLLEIAQNLLRHQDTLEMLAGNGQKNAELNHTWAKRAEYIDRFMKGEKLL